MNIHYLGEGQGLGTSSIGLQLLNCKIKQISHIWIDTTHRGQYAFILAFLLFPLSGTESMKMLQKSIES